MKRRTKIAAGLAALAALALGGAAIANATGWGDGGGLSSTEAARASAAALRATGGGEVLEQERDDEGGATYEVEVRKRDGSTVEVRLDASYEVVGIAADDDDKGGDDEGQDDDER